MTESTGVELGIGSEFIGYRIEADVGRGGMGVVYRAYDLRLKRNVALKLIAPEYASDARFRERFLAETELAASLENWGYRPGKFWALVVAATELIAGPLLALGLFTRLAALPIFVFLALSAAAHGKRDGYFWTIHGAEYPLVWSAIALFFLINGGGAFSLDRVFGFDF